MSSNNYSADFFQDFDIRLLSNDEQQELIDFYHSLIERNKGKKNKHSKNMAKEKVDKKYRSALLSFSVEPFQPLKRDEIYAR